MPITYTQNVYMDRSWINSPCLSDVYKRGVEEFKQFAQRNASNSDNGLRIRCPYANCLNGRTLSAF